MEEGRNWGGRVFVWFSKEDRRVIKAFVVEWVYLSTGQ